jgi:hypothetical protein
VQKKCEKNAICKNPRIKFRGRKHGSGGGPWKALKPR